MGSVVYKLFETRRFLEQVLHGTENLMETYQISGAMELAMACATYGLVMGGIIGGPVAKALLKRKNIQPSKVTLEHDYFI